jgi:hypothetical protein
MKLKRFLKRAATHPCGWLRTQIVPLELAGFISHGLGDSQVTWVTPGECGVIRSHRLREKLQQNK